MIKRQGCLFYDDRRKAKTFCDILKDILQSRT